MDFKSFGLVALILSVLLPISQGQAVAWLNTFTIAGYSAQWAAYGGYASNLLPTNNPYAANSPVWNSGADWGNYPQPYWVSFDFGADYSVYQFEFVASGDTTHDPDAFEIQASNSVAGPYTTVGSFNGAAGTTAVQVFTLNGIGSLYKARYWKLNILYTHSQYQAYVAYVNFNVFNRNYLNFYTITGYSSQWEAYNGYATNVLPVNNPTAANDPIWNSGADWGNYPQPYWLSFDLGAPLVVSQFVFKAKGDTTHDPEYFDLQISSSASGPYTTVQSFTAANTDQFQVFTLSTPTQAQFWKFNIEYTYSPYQAYVAYVNFVASAAPPTSPPTPPPSGCAPFSGSNIAAGGNYKILIHHATYGYAVQQQLPIGIHPWGLGFTTSTQASATTWWFNSTSSFNSAPYGGYGFTAQGIQGILTGPQGTLNGAYGGSEIVRYQDTTNPNPSWNFAFATNVGGYSAPNVAPAVIQIGALINGKNYGYALKVLNDNGVQTLATYGYDNVYAQVDLYVCL